MVVDKGGSLLGDRCESLTALLGKEIPNATKLPLVNEKGNNQQSCQGAWDHGSLEDCVECCVDRFCGWTASDRSLVV